jgi:hypothetical protein
MKSILRMLFSIPGFRKWLAVLVLSVIIADGLAIQAGGFEQQAKIMKEYEMD